MDIQFLQGLPGGPPVPAGDPATTRLGILVRLRFNAKGLAQMLRLGYLPYGRYVAWTGYGPKGHAQIVASLQALIAAYVTNGGDARALKGAILSGSGNRRHPIRLSAPAQAILSAWLAQDADYQALQAWLHQGGLSGPVSGGGLGAADAMALIKAASAVLNSILKLLDKAQPNDPNDPIPDEYQPDESPPDDSSEQSSPDVVPTRSTAPSVGAKEALLTAFRTNYRNIGSRLYYGYNSFEVAEGYQVNREQWRGYKVQYINTQSQAERQAGITEDELQEALRRGWDVAIHNDAVEQDTRLYQPVASWLSSLALGLDRAQSQGGTGDLDTLRDELRERVIRPNIAGLRGFR